MHFVSYCRECDAVTGWEVGLKNMTCKKCGRTTKTPLIRWGAGLILFTGLAALSVWVILTGIGIIASML